MGILPIVVAAIAAGAILLIIFGLVSSAPIDPVQARLTQLGTMQARNLEELELQAPFVERTLRPLAARLSSSVSRVTSSSFTERTEKRLALAGNPGDIRVADWLGVKAIGAIIGAGLFFFLFAVMDVAEGGRRAEQRHDAVADHRPKHEHVVSLVAVPGAACRQGGQPQESGEGEEAKRDQRAPESVGNPRGNPGGHSPTLADGPVRLRLPRTCIASGARSASGRPAIRSRARATLIAS